MRTVDLSAAVRPAARAPSKRSRRMVVLAALLTAFTAGAADTVIHAGALLDGVSAKPRKEVTLTVRGDRVVAIEAGFKTPAGATVIDLSKQTVMPGFIDCHVHLSMRLPGAVNVLEDWLTHSDLDRAFDAQRFARQMLQQGFTSARDVGGGDETVALRNAIADQKVPGPRLWVALEPLGPTGGHGDPMGGLDQALTRPGWQFGLVDSVDQARLRVREHRRRGADLIKLMLSGGIASTGDDPHQQLMTNDELKAAVDAAHALGMKVAAHTYPSAAIDNAINAGVDSVEHGSFVSAPTLARMKAKGTFLVPTLSVFEVALRVAQEHPEKLPPGTVEKELANDPQAKRNFPLAVKSGVRVAYGTDLGEGDHGLEFGLMVSAGMSPADALFTATRNAAELLGASDRVGSLQVGRFADLVATDGDPLRDPREFSKVKFVMKGGVVYRANGTPTVADY